MQLMSDEMTRRDSEVENLKKAEAILAEEMSKFQQMKERENISEIDNVKIDWYNIDLSDVNRQMLLLKMVENWVSSMREKMTRGQIGTTEELLKRSVIINKDKKPEIVLRDSSAPPLQTLLSIFKDDLGSGIGRRLQNIVVQTENFR